MYPPDFELASTMSIAARISSYREINQLLNNSLSGKTIIQGLDLLYQQKKEIYCERRKMENLSHYLMAEYKR